MVKDADLTPIKQPTVRCEYVKTLGSSKEAWRAIRLTVYDGLTIQKQLASQLKISLLSKSFDGSSFTTTKGKDKQMDDVYHEEKATQFICECRIENLMKHLDTYLM